MFFTDRIEILLRREAYKNLPLESVDCADWVCSVCDTSNLVRTYASHLFLWTRPSSEISHTLLQITWHALHDTSRLAALAISILLRVETTLKPHLAARAHPPTVLKIQLSSSSRSLSLSSCIVHPPQQRAGPIPSDIRLLPPWLSLLLLPSFLNRGAPSP